MRLTDQDCADIAITAAEGGTGYWAVITSDYDPVTSDDWDHGRRPIYYEIVEEEPWNLDTQTPFVVNGPAIRRGYRRLQVAGVELYDPGYPAAMDAEEADMVVQYAMFGKVVYG